jgi:Sulfotransferase domain
MTTSPDASALTRASDARAPSFFIVGHPKCGTTALYEMLRRHPQIHMPVKEPWFFASEQISQPASGLPLTLEDYLSLFDGARADQRVGEATPGYLRSPTAAKRIADLQPGARIVAIFREPAAFLRSFHLQSVQAHVETERDFRRALALEELRRDGNEIPRKCARPEALLYSDHVRYVDQLCRYTAVFPPEQVLVLIYDDFRRENEVTIRRVLRFLEVDDTGPIDVVEANPTVRLRSPEIEQLVSALYQGQHKTSGAIKLAVKALTPRRARQKAVQTIQRRVVYAHPQPPDEALMCELRRRFRGEVVALSEYLGRDLVTLWGYDGIA